MPAPHDPAEILEPLICSCDACGVIFTLTAPFALLLSIYTAHHYLFCDPCDKRDIPPLSINVH